MGCRKVKCEANRNKNRQTQLILCSAAMDEVKREVRIISSVSYYFFFFFSNIIKSHIILEALTLFLLLTLLLLGYNQETVWTTGHLPLQRPNNSSLITNGGQISIGGGVGVHLLRYRHWSICCFPFKILDTKNLSFFSANVRSFNKLIRHENFTNCLEDSQDIKL